MNVYAVRLDGLNEAVFTFIMSRLELERQARINAYKNSEDAARSLLGDVLSRTLLCEQSGMKWDNLDVRRSAYGKPYSARTGLEYSVSHAGDWIVCAMNDCAVGVDVEKIRPVDLNIARYFFTDDEKRAILSRKPEHREEYFFELWTAKESCLKAQGTGLFGALDAFSVAIGDSKLESMKEVTVNSLPEANLHVYLSQPFPGYKLAVCSYGSFDPRSVMVLSFESLLQRFLAVL